MKRIARTVYLPSDLSEWLNKEAERRGISGNAIVVTLLEGERERQQRPAPKAPTLDTNSGPMDFD